MRLDIGHLNLSAPDRGTTTVRPADSIDLIGAIPPPEVLAEVDAAAARAAELAAVNRELHFELDERPGRVIVQVRDLEGTVLHTIAPSSALDVMAGEALQV